jgi:dihydropteroate synthase
MKKVDIPKHIRKKHPHHRPAFIRKIVGVRVKRIKASYESLKEWRKDPKGYFIIKVFYDKGYFGARFHTYDAVPHADIVGTDAEAIVQTIVREKLVTSLQHAAYLGHELHKAEIALKHRLNFVQDSDLDFSRKTRKKESDNLPE